MVVRLLSKELQEIAIKKLNEDPERLEDDLKLMREWAETQSHLKIRTDDQWLLSFLRGCRFNFELAKDKLDLLYTMRSNTPEWYANRDPLLPEIQELLKLGILLPLPNKSDPAAPRVLLFRECTETHFRVEDKAKLAFMILDILINEDDNYVVAGSNVVVDTNNSSFTHFFQIRPHMLNSGYKIMKDGYALRVRSISLINVPWVVQLGYNSFKYIASEEVLKVVHFYNDENIDELYETVPMSILPEEYGGDGGSLENLTIEWKKKVESYRDWFLEENKYDLDKTECPEKPESSEDSFGIEGFIC